MWGRIVVSLCLAACGRGGFDDYVYDGDAGPPDFVPDSLTWPDFDNVSEERTFSGINRPIDVQLEATNGNGSPVVSYRLDGEAAVVLQPGIPTTITVQPGAKLQFRISGMVGQTAFIAVTNLTTGGTLIDTVLGMAASLVTGDGTPLAPYAAPGAPPVSCNAFLAAFPEMAGVDGTYEIMPGAQLDAYCDMTTDSGGWTLVARVLGTSTTHTTEAALGAVASPTQGETVKYADAIINTLQFTHTRFRIEAVGTVYASQTSISLGTTAYSLMNAAAPTFAGPYTLRFYTATGCSGDCGVSICPDPIGFGSYCGYRYWASGGNPRPGMGCNGNFSKAGTVWVR